MLHLRRTYAGDRRPVSPSAATHPLWFVQTSDGGDVRRLDECGRLRFQELLGEIASDWWILAKFHPIQLRRKRGRLEEVESLQSERSYINANIKRTCRGAEPLLELTDGRKV